MKILIIEDEPKTAKDLANTIKKVCPEAEVVAYVDSVSEGKLFFQNPQNIDLIFSDIQLGDGLSFDIFEVIKPQVAVIFCTAYDEYALRAFKTFGIDYLLKPFSKEAVGKAIEKYQALIKPNQQPPLDFDELIKQIKKEIQPQNYPLLIVQRGEKILTLQPEKIALFFIENDTVYAHDFETNRKAIDLKMEELEIRYSPLFYRANRQSLVNRAAIKDVSQHFNRKVELNLNIPFFYPLLISKEKKSDFLEWLEKR